MLVRQPASISLARDILLPIQNADITNLRTKSEEYGVESISSVAEQQLVSLVNRGDADFLEPLQHFFSKHWHTRAAYLIDRDSSTIRSFSGGRDWVIDPQTGLVSANLCDSSKTIVNVTKELDPNAVVANPRVYSDGKVDLVEPKSPLGAYYPDGLKEKISLTKQAKAIAKENNIDVIIPEWIAAITFTDKNGVEMAAGVYEMPNARPVHYLSQEDEATQHLIKEKVAKAVKGFIDADFIHAQLHLGNIWYFQDKNGEWQIIFTDWAGAYSIKEHDRVNKNWVEEIGNDPVNELLTPRQLAIRYMLLPLLDNNGQFIKGIYNFKQDKDLNLWDTYKQSVTEVYRPFVSILGGAENLFGSVFKDRSVRLYYFLIDLLDDEMMGAIGRENPNSPQEVYKDLDDILFKFLPSIISRLILKGIIAQY